MAGPTSPFGNGPSSLPGPMNAPTDPTQGLPAPQPSSPPPASDEPGAPGSPVMGPPTPAEGPGLVKPDRAPANDLSAEENAKFDAYIPGHPQSAAALGAPPVDDHGQYAPTAILRQYSLGRSDTDRVAIMQKVFGAANATLQDGKVYYRNPGESTFHPVAPNLSNVWDDITHQFNLRKGASDFLDTMNANAQDIAEGATNTMAYMTGAAVAGGATGGLGALAGGSAAAGLAQGAQSLWRSKQIDELLGQKFSVDKAGKLALTDTGLSMAGNFLAGGMLDLGAAAVGRVASVVSSAVDNIPINRVKSVAVLNQQIADLASSYVPKTFGPISATAGPELNASIGAAGTYVTGAIEKQSSLNVLYDKYLSKYDPLARDYMRQNTGSKVDVSPMIAKIKEVVEPYVKFDGLNPVEIGGQPSHTPVQSMIGYADLEERMLGGNSPSSVSATGAPKPSGLSAENLFAVAPPFGSKTGMRTLNTVMDHYQYLLDAQANGGGMDFDTFNRMQKTLTQLSGFKDGTPLSSIYDPSDKKIFKNILGSAIESKDQIFQAALGGQGSPMYEAYTADKSRYGAAKDSASYLFDLFAKDNTAPSMVMDKAFALNSPIPVQNLKVLLGTDPEVMGQLKSGFIQSILRKTGDANNYVMDTGHFYDLVSQYSKSGIAQELFTSTEQNQLRRMALQARKIPTMDLTRATDQGDIKNAITMGLVGAGDHAGTGMQGRLLYSMMGANAKAYNYMMETDLPQRLAAAQEGQDFGAINKFAGLIQTLSDYRFMSKTIKVGNKEMLVPLPALKQTLQSIGQKYKNTGIDTVNQTTDQ